MSKPIATYAKTKEILAKYDLTAQKKYGQNFIIDPSVVEKIAAESCLDAQSAVIEIGPGIGALSEQLAKRAKTVVAYEIDEKLVEVLKDTLSEYQNVRVIGADFTKIDLKETVRGLKENHDRVLISANLPYYITTSLLMKIFESDAPIDALTVMMQKEVADHFFLPPPSKERSALNILAESGFSVSRVMKVPKTVFDPKPAVESAVIRFTPHRHLLPEGDRSAYYAFVKACFKQRRKSLLNNLSAALCDKEKAKRVLEKAEIDVNVRAEALSAAQFAKLFEVKNEE